MAAPLFSNPVTAIAGIVIIGYTLAPQDAKDKINQAIVNVYGKMRNQLYGLLDVEDEKELTISIIKNELLEQGIIADVTIDKNTGKININEISSSKNSNGKKEGKESQKKDEKKGNNETKKTNEENKNHKDPNNNKPTESKLPPNENQEGEISTSELNNSVGSNIDLVYENGKNVFNNFNIEEAYVKPKHLAITGGNGAKFLGATKAEAEVLLKETITNGKIVSIIDDGLTPLGNPSYAIFIDAGKAIGTKGENLVKIILASDGGMISAYPVKSIATP